MSRICEFHADVLTNGDAIKVAIPIFLTALQDKPRVSNQICSAIENLAASLAPQYESQPANQLTPYFEQIFNALITNAYRKDAFENSVDLGLASFTAISSLAENCCDDSKAQLYNYLIPVL